MYFSAIIDVIMIEAWQSTTQKIEFWAKTLVPMYLMSKFNDDFSKKSDFSKNDDLSKYCFYSFLRQSGVSSISKPNNSRSIERDNV